MAETIENGPASGASAVKLGVMAIASGMCDCVLVIGGEAMREVTGWEGTDFVATMLHPTAEYKYGAHAAVVCRHVYAALHGSLRRGEQGSLHRLGQKP